MLRLEEIQQGTQVRGVVPSSVVKIEAVSWVGEQAIKASYRTPVGVLGERLLYRDDEPSLAAASSARRWSLDGDGDLLCLVSEVNRIHLAWLFDPYGAVSSSLIQPLPHQSAAVREEPHQRRSPQQQCMSDSA